MLVLISPSSYSGTIETQPLATESKDASVVLLVPSLNGDEFLKVFQYWTRQSICDAVVS